MKKKKIKLYQFSIEAVIRMNYWEKYPPPSLLAIVSIHLPSLPPFVSYCQRLPDPIPPNFSTIFRIFQAPTLPFGHGHNLVNIPVFKSTKEILNIQICLQFINKY